MIDDQRPTCPPGPTEAQLALRAGERLRRTGERDRPRYALGMATTGVVMAVYMITLRLLDGSRLATVGYAIVVAGLIVWQRRATDTVPLGARRLGLYGGIGLFVVGMVATIAMNFAERHGEAVAAGWYAAAIAATAAPMLAAAWLSAKAGR